MLKIHCLTLSLALAIPIYGFSTEVSTNQATNHGTSLKNQYKTSPPARQGGLCNQENNYLESLIGNEIQSGNLVFQELSRYQLKSPQLNTCIQKSMEIVGSSVTQVNPNHCLQNDKLPIQKVTSAEGKVTTRLLKAKNPCYENRGDQKNLLIDATHKSFELISQCTANTTNESLNKIANRSSFALINMESGFYFNSVNKSGSSGIAQLTKVAIEELNKSVIPEMMKEIKQSSQPSCQILSKMELTAIRPGFEYSCDRINPKKGHPVTGFLYMAAHQKQIRRSILSNLKAADISLKNLSDEKREELISALALWGNNTGSRGITGPFISLVKSENGSRLLQSGQIDKLLVELENEIEATYRYRQVRNQKAISENRIKEIRSFYRRAKEKQARVESAAGRTACTF